MAVEVANDHIGRTVGMSLFSVIDVEVITRSGFTGVEDGTSRTFCVASRWPSRYYWACCCVALCVSLGGTTLGSYVRNITLQ